MSLSRRSFLHQFAGATTAGFFCEPGNVLADDRWRDYLDQAGDLLGRRFSLDMHMHPALFPVKDIPRSSNPRTYRGDDAFASRIEGMRKGRMWTGFFSPVVDAPVLGMTPQGPGMVRPFEPGEAWTEFQRQITVLDDLLRRNGVVKATSVAEVAAAHSEDKVAAIFGCEGGDHIEDRPERVEDMYEIGVRCMQIYHVAPNSLVKVDGRRDNGLTGVGRDTIREMNRVGLVADLAHASFRTTADAAEVTTQPLLSTHSLLRSEQGRSSVIGLTREHLKVVADSGGVIGTFGGVGGGIAEFANQVMRLIDVVGVDHVGIGTDMDGTGSLPAAFNAYPLFPEVAARLLAQGLLEDEVAKVIGGNVARVLDEVRRTA